MVRADQNSTGLPSGPKPWLVLPLRDSAGISPDFVSEPTNAL